MALNLSSVFVQPKHVIPCTHKLYYSSIRRAALSEQGDGRVTKEEDLPTYSGMLLTLFSSF
uniref:Uncharacterized protein n=1 Tax=Solanum tuberosum TaxID=4113 RepID=M1BGE8_SOLTU